MASYTLNDGKMYCDIADGIAVVINAETGIYYGMNAFGTDAFENILNGVPAEAVLKAALALPGAPDDLPARWEAFVAELLKYEIILEGAGQNNAGSAADWDGANLNAENAAQDGFVLEVTEYTDAQEMLLADPIHEFVEERGWQPEKSALKKAGEGVPQTGE